MKYFKKKNKTISKELNRRKEIISDFVNLYGDPVIVHSVRDVKIFEKILRDGKLELPKNHSSPKKTPYMERFLGIDNCIYYSLGFTYASNYEWKYNFIFDLDYIKKLKYYKSSVNYKAYREIINYLYDFDKCYLDKMENKNEKTKKVFYKYYHTKYNGEVRKIFNFWEIEKELFESIEKYPKKVRLIKIAKDVAKKLLLKYPDSLNDAELNYLSDQSPEIIGKKQNNLFKNKYFLGFYINGKLSNKIKKILKNKYGDKIIFDGHDIKKISKL